MLERVRRKVYGGIVVEQRHGVIVPAVKHYRAAIIFVRESAPRQRLLMRVQKIRICQHVTVQTRADLVLGLAQRKFILIHVSIIHENLYTALRLISDSRAWKARTASSFTIRSSRTRSSNSTTAPLLKSDRHDLSCRPYYYCSYLIMMQSDRELI